MLAVVRAQAKCQKRNAKRQNFDGESVSSISTEGSSTAEQALVPELENSPYAEPMIGMLFAKLTI
jgi:hypothetical protein